MKLCVSADLTVCDCDNTACTCITRVLVYMHAHASVCSDGHRLISSVDLTYPFIFKLQLRSQIPVDIKMFSLSALNFLSSP